jgi:NADPH:quinone reductase
MKNMKALLLNGPNDWTLSEIPIPTPKKGQVLVKMAFSPINPSDLAFLTGNYGLKKAYPVVPGLEGSGTVTESGGGFLANRLLGKRVACTAPSTGNGTWTEYLLTDASKCIDLNKNVSLEQGAMLFVNPLTALSFSKQAKKFNADLIVFTAAGSALGQMLTYFAAQIGLPVFGIIRKKSLKEEVLKNGFKEVFCTEDPEYLEQLKSKSKNYRRVIFFDAVGGGTVSYEVLNVLPDHTKMVIYGRLDQNAADFSPQNILFKQNSIEGYWLSKEAQTKNLLEIIMDVRKIQRMLGAGFETKVQKIIDLTEINKGLEEYYGNMSAGKVLLKL